MNQPRLYCKTCNEFKQLKYGGGRTSTGWVCKSCYKKIQEKVRQQNDRDS